MSATTHLTDRAITRRGALKAGGGGLAAILLSRRAPAVIAQGQTEISFAGIKIFGEDPMPALLQQFETANPGIKVKYIELPTPNNSTEIHQYLVTSLNAKNGEPDVFTQDIIWISEFGAAGLSAELSKFVSDADKAAYYPGLIEACTYQDKLVGWPWFVDGGFLYYRKDLLDKYSLKAPTSWDDLVSAAQEVMGKEGNAQLQGFLWQAKQAEVLVCDWVEFLGSAGGSTLTDNKVTVNSDAGVKALQLMQDLIYKDKVTPQAVLTYDEEPSRRPFTSGDAVFLRNWSYAYALAQNPDESKVVDKVGYEPLPHFPEGKSASCLGGYQFGLNASSKQPEAAWKLLSFLSGPDAQKTLALKAGVAPTRQAVYDDAELKQKNPFMVGLKEVFVGATPRPVNPSYPQISLAMQSALSTALTNRTPAKQALDSLASDLETIVG
jgi:multiple sugar transport system substrate-binding protein